ncbi:MAG: hypothetical protein OEY52_02920 [Gammaproteobacteria bacterium]|nr:hypothetical protein [Gammaproteobacteria bacterium]
MIKTIPILAGLLVVPVQAWGIDVTKIPFLTDAKQIHYAQIIKDRSNAVLTSVKKCSDKTGRSHRECLCDSKELVLAHRQAIKQAFERNPSWLQKGWIRFKTRTGEDITFNITGMQRQLKMAIPCSKNND